MGVGAGIFFVAVGAILVFAVNAPANGIVNLHAVGWILMIVGALGTLLSMAFWSSWAGPGYFSRRRRMYVEGPPPPVDDY